MSERMLRMPSMERKLGCKKSKIYQLINRGILPPPCKIDGASVWPESEADAYIDRLKAERGEVANA